MADDPTLGELKRLIERNHIETREAIAAIHQRLDRDVQAMNDRVDKTAASAVAREVYEADQRGLRDRVVRIESDLKSARATTRWAIGLCTTALLAVAALVVNLAAS